MPKDEDDMHSNLKFHKRLFPLISIVSFTILSLMPISLKAESSWWEKATKIIKPFTEGKEKNELTVAEIGQAFKEALHIGTENVVSQLGSTNGFNADPTIHIPLPKELNKVKNVLSKIGMSNLLEDLELKLNRAAEAATPKAKALFWDAITAMTFEDVKAIYNGPENAATKYFQNKMSTPLSKEFRPIVDDSLSQVGAIQSYDKVIDQYKSLPFVPDVKADLTNHVLEKGIEGIFYYIAKEEAAIRQNPTKQTTALLKRVFGAK
jgi:hypothetical protein